MGVKNMSYYLHSPNVLQPSHRKTYDHELPLAMHEFKITAMRSEYLHVQYIVVALSRYCDFLNTYSQELLYLNKLQRCVFPFLRKLSINRKTYLDKKTLLQYTSERIVHTCQ